MFGKKERKKGRGGGAHRPREDKLPCEREQSERGNDWITNTYPLCSYSCSTETYSLESGSEIGTGPEIRLVRF